MVAETGENDDGYCKCRLSSMGWSRSLIRQAVEDNVEDNCSTMASDSNRYLNRGKCGTTLPSYGGGMRPILFNMEFSSQIQCRREFWIFARHARYQSAWGMTERQKSNIAPTLGLQCVYRKRRIVAAAWMRNMIGASAHRMPCTNVPQIKHKWCVHRQRWMKTRGGRPSAITHASNLGALITTKLQRNPNTVAKQLMPV